MMKKRLTGSKHSHKSYPLVHLLPTQSQLMAAVNKSSNTPAAAPTLSNYAIPLSSNTQSVLKREFQMSGEAEISAFPEEDNTWKGTISGIKETVFEGTEYNLSLPTDYPFKLPKVKFDTGCFHPNLDFFGNVCLDILQDKWSSANEVRTIQLSVQSLIGVGEPNTSSPLNNQAAANVE